MPSINITQTDAEVYFNAPEGVDLSTLEGSVVSLTGNPDIPELVGNPLTALPTKTQLLGLVTQIQPDRGTCCAVLVGMYAGLVKASLAETPGTISVGTPVTVTANGTWKAAASGDTVYARVIHEPWEPGKIEIGFVAPYQVAAA